MFVTTIKETYLLNGITKTFKIITISICGMINGKLGCTVTWPDIMERHFVSHLAKQRFVNKCSFVPPRTPAHHYHDQCLLSRWLPDISHIMQFSSHFKMDLNLTSFS